MVWLHTRKLIIVMIGAAINAMAMNFFLIPANVYASGFTGFAQLLSNILGTFAPFEISTGILLFILNIPIIILAWLKLGKFFTIYSSLSVLFTTFFLEVFPIIQVSGDIFLNAVFGGVIAGVCVGITLKWGASTGGMDIVAMLLSRSKDQSVGTYLFTLNSIIIITAGFIFGWEKALYTIVQLYVSTRVIDAIHTRHEKLTAMIVTEKASELKKAIHSRLSRGITTVPAKGGFTNTDKDLIFIVITRYELFDLKRILSEVDPRAFTNIVETSGVLGLFRKE